MKRIINAMGGLTWWRRERAVFVLGAMAAIALPAQTFTTLHRFDSADCGNPGTALVQATNGALYGTTEGGGTANSGTIFNITPGGVLTTPYSSCPNGPMECPNGSAGSAPLVQAPNGDLYGTASLGDNAFGSVFEVTLSGALTTIYTFGSSASWPNGPLVQATNGDFYGTTYLGGDNYCYILGTPCGTVFKITPSGALTTVYNFCAQIKCADGALPTAGLIQATNGDLYGTTEFGGANCVDSDGCGTVFRITPSGTLTTLYSFCLQDQNDCPDGYYPVAGLVQAGSGDLYGTTSNGGANGQGTIFKITPEGTLTTLYTFCAQSGCPDGAYPAAALIQATDGDLYGTIDGGGANGGGTILKITPGGALTTLYSFCAQGGCIDGSSPGAPLVQDTSGDFYGTTVEGGVGNGPTGQGCGTIFGLSVGLGLFVKTLPASGKAGAAVSILGTNLTGVTSVTFDGIRATVELLSPTEIVASVPAGASSGKVKVVTASGTLSSDVPFRVLP
jgi:uncharacterized repeat protein (TIGR03803 family)